ncbi:nucleotidyltransferase family protein [Cohaesibacter gelatinilyticus]|uniref:Molybdenum cofactor cytidylyltransferase n=1 Tax=Cohaesibacter gelatinilyticus TaxID=372072 RepID=A0A285PGD0_9HYPH|nr:nucleotidyltransferase family protein [Cohaesibacter gelatinilyticus]SNZ20317.1 molybdenum cofactor cytidylyltransferase [Cohaesibacter gelatinilyticus]
MSNYSNFEVILLAAGLSRRMGSVNKLLLPIRDEALVRRTASLYCSLGMRVHVILGHEAPKVRSQLQGLQLTTIVNPDFEQGQKTSVRVGLQHVLLDGDGLLIALSDQPLLQSSDIAALCDAYLQGQQDKVLVPHFQVERGNPILFPSSLAKQISDQGRVPGCRRFIDANPDQVQFFAAKNNHFTFDLDTPEDLARSKETLKRTG